MAPSREAAHVAISTGNVTVAGAPALKASRLVSPDQPVVVSDSDRPRFVGRGGTKLDAALDAFGVDVTNRIVLDAGASTGGFTDCLLQRGAARVIAVDVGYGQLHERIRTDPRVHVLDRTNVRHLTRAELPPDPAYPDLVVADLSFISLRTVAAALIGIAGARGALVVLVKPQFEAGRAAVSRHKGIVKDPGEWRAALAGVVHAFDPLAFTLAGLIPSPITGTDGNVEFLAHFTSEPAANDRAPRRDVDATIDAVVAEVATTRGKPSSAPASAGG